VPVANPLGLHTAYGFDRIAGLYHSPKDELVSPRTVRALGTYKPIDLFNLRRRCTMDGSKLAGRKVIRIGLF
jgi:hypothetical protein